MRPTREGDLDAIVALGRRIYRTPWRLEELRSHLQVFPEGQHVAVTTDPGMDGLEVVEDGERLAGMTASLIIAWDDYDFAETWEDYTANGHFTNHDPDSGRTLYGAEVMVAPECRRTGVGSRLYEARFELTRRLRLRRIRAHARLAGYEPLAGAMTAREYVLSVVRGERRDPTLSFQLRHGFRVLAVVSGYLPRDSRSLGWAALIEWLHEEVVGPGTGAVP